MLDATELEDADWGMYRSLCFVDERIESRYCLDLIDCRYKLGLLIVVFYTGCSLFDNVVRKSWHRFGSHDGALLLTASARLLHLAGMAGSTVVLACRKASVEAVFIFIMYSQPLVLMLLNLYRMSRLLGSNAADLEFGVNCRSYTCYGHDDSILILTLLIAATLPLLMSVRIARSWFVVPWSTALYLAFSVGDIGPLDSSSHVVVSSLFLSICFFIQVGTYRIERDLRIRWAEALRFKIKNRLQSRALKKQRRWLREMEEKTRAMSANFDEDFVLEDTASSLEEAESVAPVVVEETDPDVELRVPLPMRMSPGLPLEASPTSLRAAVAVPRAFAEPNVLLVQRMAGRTMDLERLRKMAECLLQDSYGMREFFDDAVHTFPELELFFALEDSTSTSSGLCAEVEYQRTIGALFAVYWLIRLDKDGKHGFCYGCDGTWRIKRGPLVPRTRTSQKREQFFDDMEWATVRTTVTLAMDESVERLQAMLCLTAFHDIMKVQALCPRVSAEHAPYEGYKEGDVIHDHDVALAYVLEHYPHILPSFRSLPQASRDVILFTQGKMHFNHGWFVQAEAPPGATLTKFKAALQKAQPRDLSFYFFHWLTDLSGAEGQPLGGAEKFVLRFPRSVLAAFLWSIPHLQLLTTAPETKVMEHYLEARFQTATVGPLPVAGEDAIALMRLTIMAQGSGNLVKDAYFRLPPVARAVLAVESARTGAVGQAYERTPVTGGPALFVYYGPALLQRCTTGEEMFCALRCLAAVYHAARQLWPVRLNADSDVVLLEAGGLKAQGEAVVAGHFCSDRGVMIVSRRSSIEGVVAFITNGPLNDLVSAGAYYCAVDPNGLSKVLNNAEECEESERMLNL